LLEQNEMNVHLLNEIISILEKSGNGKNLNDKVRLSLAIGMFVEKTVTLERASELAGRSLSNFIDILRAKSIPWMEYTNDHVADDEQAMQKYVDGTK
jgi:predicted HTH domain antitoxin